MTPERYQRLTALFEAACERGADARASFLDDACAGDDALRREVEELLAADQKSRGLLEKPLAAVAPILTTSQIGPYRIEAKLGEGGMGMVFRALDTKLNRPVAIKFLAGDLVDAPARRRFQREAQMASSLNHPHIVMVLDAGELDCQQYLVTEYIDGGTLKDWAKAEKPAWRQIVEMLVGVADDLAAAHAAGITHRDIKPTNILVASNGYAKLADFGLAKLAENTTPDAAIHTGSGEATRPGVIVGTIAYMSPEQASGRQLENRSDIFSFGVLLYELLAGHRPFVGETELEELKTIIHGAAQPLPEDVPAALRVVVEKALEKDPADRYQSMREMVVDLRRCLRQSAEIAISHPSRNFARLAAVVLVLMALAAGGALVALKLRQAGAPTHLEYTQLTNFADSAISPALSPDGRMLTFIRTRGEKGTLGARGEIYIKLLPDGEPVQLTHDGKHKMAPVFVPGGDRIAYGTTGHMADPTSWATWTVPVFGGEPSLLLSNTSALTWIPGMTPPRVLFSEFDHTPHMSIVTSAENRSEARTVYAPANPGGMAHRSYLSPHGKHTLIIEMDGGWKPCRLAPFDGSSPGKLVGPSPGQCATATWSPDGSWMYFSVNTGNGYHISRQKFPDGAPEQVTFGATEEVGIAFAPDGRSFLTSVGTRQSTLWLHDRQGDRQITSEGYASVPQFSPDGKKLYYLLRSHENRRYVSGELWSANLETGKRARLLPDFLIEDYRVSPDGNRRLCSDR